MAYFHCLIGGGSSGGGYTLTVTCDSQFAGTTITCTDGVTTLTATCPSASPYEVEFEIPNGGDWTISGVISGHTMSTGVNIPTAAELIAILQQTITIYSAKEDTVTYTDIYGDTQTEVFASGQTSKSITVDIMPSGSSITFTSGVAKDPGDLTDYYSKTVTIDSNTTNVYLMPDSVTILYWYGYISNDLQNVNTSNGWSVNNYAFATPTYNTNDISNTSSSSGNGTLCGVGTSSPRAVTKVTGIISGQGTQVLNYYGYINILSAKNINQLAVNVGIDTTSMKKYEITNSGTYNILVYGSKGAGNKIHALWYE